MKTLKKFICMLLSVTLIVGCMTAAVGAEEENPSFTTSGSYERTVTIGPNLQIKDCFTFEEDCFMRPSSAGCSHLGLLSAQAAMAAGNRFGLLPDLYKVDISDGAYNLVRMLGEMGFEDVQANSYYTSEPMENSIAAAVGRKTISAFGKTYTLLAIIPRGNGYRQEWAGNFTFGDGDFHVGYKAARDEVLRFVKQYIQENNISGDLKVWTTGHSRGGSVANMVGAFFAGGGIEYFGDAVSITPEDVYCYTFAPTPVVKDGADKNEVFSVEGNRGGVYAEDTPQDPYAYTGGGTISVDDSDYAGIRNFIIESDPVAMMPLPSWGFSHFGTDIYMDAKTLAEDELLNLIEDADPLHRFFTVGDTDLLSIAAALISQDQYQSSLEPTKWAAFWKQRIEAFTSIIESNAIYADEGYQDALKSAFGLVGLLETCITDIDLRNSYVLKAMTLSYLAYAAERLKEEGRAADDAEAGRIVLEELLNSLFGIQIDLREITVDKLFTAVLNGFVANEESEAVEEILSALVEQLPKDKLEMLRNFFGAFHPDYESGMSEEELPSVEIVKAMLRAGVFGAAEGSSVYEEEEFRDPSYVRKLFYTLIGTALSDKYKDIDQIIGMDEDEVLDGSGTAEDLIRVLMKNLLVIKDDQGEVVLTCETLDEAADAAFGYWLFEDVSALIETAEPIYGMQYADFARGHLDLLIENVRAARRAFFYTICYTEGVPFSVFSSLGTALAFVVNFWQVPAAHCGETYIMLMKMQSDPAWGSNDHSVEYVKEKKQTHEKDGNTAYWIWKDGSDIRYYSDRALSNEISKEDTVIPAGHRFAISVNPASKSSYGTINEKCEICGFEREIEIIPRIGSVKLSRTSYTYNGKAKKPKVIVKDSYGKPISDYYYNLEYSEEPSINAGSYTVTVSFLDNYQGTEELTYKINKQSNTINKVIGAKKYSYSTLKKRNRTLTLKASVKENAKTTYVRSSVTAKAKKYITVSSSGKVTVKKGIPKGTYTLKVKVTAAETANYKKTTKTKTIKITVA